MREQYRIICEDIKIDDILMQVKAISKFPCSIAIYDRIFLIDSADGIYGLLQGLEIGFYLLQEELERKK